MADEQDDDHDGDHEDSSPASEPEAGSRRSLMPIQAAPVQRPDLVHPHQTLDVEHGSAQELFAVRMALVHGANYNDPAPFDACAAARHWGGGSGCGGES